MPESDPPRKTYRLKPKEFERVNDPIPASPPPASSPSPAPDAPTAETADGAIDVRQIARQATTGVPLLQGNAPANRPNEIHALLRQNVAQADARGLNDLAPLPKRRSRRTRDYFLLLIPLDAFFAYWAFSPQATPFTLVYGLAGLVLFTVAWTWVMWFIVEDY